METWDFYSYAKNIRCRCTMVCTEEIQPLSIVERPAFIDLVKLGIPSTIRVICRKTLKEKLSKTYIKIKSALQNKLDEIEIVSTTDLWSKAKRLINNIIFY